MSDYDREVNETTSVEQLAVLEDLPIANELLNDLQSSGDNTRLIEPANELLGSIQSFVD